MPPQGSGYSYGTMPNNGHLQQIPYIQSNHIPHVPNSSNTNVQRPNDSYFNQILEKHKKDLAVMFKETFGVELKDKTLVCQKPYPESFDSIPVLIPYHILRISRCLSLLNSLGRIVELHGSILVSLMRKWEFMVVLII